MQPYKHLVELGPAVLQARLSNRPIVALESTIISHGFPYPQNIETALAVEQIIKDEGAQPATIAILDGKIKIGISEAEIHQFGNHSGSILKISRHDLPYALATKQMGATTVAATMICAHFAGIQVFATGGIGGVHRDGENSLDISADLQELAKSSVAVVCAGVKAILDIPRTLEVLETLGVPVIGYQTNDFPAFFCRKSGCTSEHRIDDVATLASMLRIKWGMGLEGGVLVGNPIEAEFALDEADMATIIAEAVVAARRQGISGKKVTPFLLKEVQSRTHGRSLTANIALVKSNAKLAAQLAIELCK